MLKKKIAERKAVIGVIGLGYVGLPLAVEKAKAGFDVIGFDIQEKKVQMVNEGHNYIGDVVNEDLERIVKEGKLRATTDFDELKNCDVAAICVPTPLNKYKKRSCQKASQRYARCFGVNHISRNYRRSHETYSRRNRFEMRYRFLSCI